MRMSVMLLLAQSIMPPLMHDMWAYLHTILMCATGVVGCTAEVVAAAETGDAPNETAPAGNKLAITKAEEFASVKINVNSMPSSTDQIASWASKLLTWTITLFIPSYAEVRSSSTP